MMFFRPYTNVVLNLSFHPFSLHHAPNLPYFLLGCNTKLMVYYEDSLVKYHHSLANLFMEARWKKWHSPTISRVHFLPNMHKGTQSINIDHHSQLFVHTKEHSREE